MSVLIDDSITIYEALENIKNGKYVMPAFQRQYVWSMEQIEKLWDSILLGYPIATFLFWHVVGWYHHSKQGGCSNGLGAVF